MGRRRNKNRNNRILQDQATQFTTPQIPQKQPALYNTLDSNEHIIRLIRVHRQPDEPTSVVFSLEEHQIDGAPEYTAISYMWGPDTEGGSIELDGHMIRVRQNLYDFLHTVVMQRAGKPNEATSFSLPNDVQLFWVDTLCINQSDVGERNHQVQMMGQIYSLANSVTVWLGREAGDSDYLFDTAKTYMNFHPERLQLSLLCFVENIGIGHGSTRNSQSEKR